MRNLLALIGAALVAFAVAGWYLGWYKVAPEGSRGYEVEVNTSKIRKDVDRGSERIERALDKGKGTTIRTDASLPDAASKTRD